MKHPSGKNQPRESGAERSVPTLPTQQRTREGAGPPGPELGAPQSVCGRATTKIMDMVNALDLDLPPRGVDSVGSDATTALPHSVLQRAVVQRRELLDILAMFGIEPIENVGVAVDYGLHEARAYRATDDPSLHHRVAMCLVTGFAFEGKAIRYAAVEVFRHDPFDQHCEDSKEKGEQPNA